MTRIDLAMFMFEMADGKDSKEGVEMALKEALEVLRLDQNDVGLIRFVIPIMFMMLDRDQDAFDFIKWYWAHGRRSPEIESHLREGEWPSYHNHDMFEHYLEPIDDAIFSYDHGEHYRGFYGLNHLFSLP